jgi:LPXTG-motif cell wall-anchored protein
MECTSDVYVVTQADIDAGRVRNVATAAAVTPPGDEVKSPPSVVDVPTARDASLGLLAFTGSNPVPFLATGVLLVLAGLALVFVARRRREPSTTA